jgi:hypothetical protein
LTLVVAVVVGYALFVYVTLDQNLGKPPVAEYGWPVTYRVEPRNADDAPNTPSQFYPAAVGIRGGMTGTWLPLKPIRNR